MVRVLQRNITQQQKQADASSTEPRGEVLQQLDTKHPLHDSTQIWFKNRQTQAVKLEVRVRAPCGEVGGEDRDQRAAGVPAMPCL